MREHFLLDPDLIFLNHGSFGACPREVLEAAWHWQREMERNPVAFLARRSASLLKAVRQELGQYLGARAEDLVLLPNATHGVNTVARSLQFQPGDEILATDHEYGACEATWDFVCRRSGARYLKAEIPLPFLRDEFVERVWSRVTPRTRVLFLSHITSTTALSFPIAELCLRARAAGILTLIDGAHAPGQIPLDLEVLGADFYTGNCHKWLCAPKGAAFLHVRPERQGLLDAAVLSWGYVEGESENEAYTGSALLERRHQWQGTRDLSAFLAIPAALAFEARHDWAQRRQDCHALALDTQHRVCELTGLEAPCGEEDFVQMALLPLPPTDPSALKAFLFEGHRIEVPVTSHRGRHFVRAAFQAYNTPEDADALVGALRAWLKG